MFIQQLLKNKRPLIMGVLNVTPDSFSDGGKFNTTDTAFQHAQRMLAEGADIIDIGGESTRPNAAIVSEQEELDRVIPIIEKLNAEIADVYISIDTSKLKVMQAAVDSGVKMINDVNALQNAGCVDYAAKTNVDICLMHMQGKPQTMQNKPEYISVTEEVLDFLKQRLQACLDAGIDKNRLLIDPGFGFGKKLSHNLELFQEIEQLLSLHYPLLIGVSRKSMFADLHDGLAVEDRMLPSVIAAVKAAEHYRADILRVHDVKETLMAIKTWRAL